MSSANLVSTLFKRSFLTKWGLSSAPCVTTPTAKDRVMSLTHMMRRSQLYALFVSVNQASVLARLNRTLSTQKSFLKHAPFSVASIKSVRARLTGRAVLLERFAEAELGLLDLHPCLADIPPSGVEQLVCFPEETIYVATPLSVAASRRRRPAHRLLRHRPRRPGRRRWPRTASGGSRCACRS